MQTIVIYCEIPFTTLIQNIDYIFTYRTETETSILLVYILSYSVLLHLTGFAFLLTYPFLVFVLLLLT